MADEPTISVSALAGVLRKLGQPHAPIPERIVRSWMEGELGADPADVEFLLVMMRDHLGELAEEDDPEAWMQCVNPRCEVYGSFKQSDTCGICEQPTRRPVYG